jgi:hypothetical protein
MQLPSSFGFDDAQYGDYSVDTNVIRYNAEDSFAAQSHRKTQLVWNELLLY